MAHRVVIVGGGFAGLNAAKGLGGKPGVTVTLIDRRNFHLFQPLLYQVASGGLSPGDITAPLRGVLGGYANVHVLMAEVTRVDVAGRRVITAEAGALDYDTLVVATGAENFYFGHDDWAAHAPALKTIEDATAIRSRILAAFEQAEREPDPAERKKWLRFVIVGAGPTGVELAGAIGEIARDTLRNDFRSIRPEQAEIQLVEGAPRVLPPFKPHLGEAAERALIGLGVRARTGVRVTSIDESGLNIETPQGPGRLDARTIIWAAGVRATPLAAALAEQTGAPADRGGRVQVGPGLTLAGHPEIFVLGDMAWCEQDGKPLPGMCPVAMQQGAYTATAILARLDGRTAPPFRYVDKGIMATIGRHAAVADLGFVSFTGLMAWLAWLFLHLLYLVGFRNRVLVAMQWAFQYATYNRGARLITLTPSGG